MPVQGPHVESLNEREPSLFSSEVLKFIQVPLPSGENDCKVEVSECPQVMKMSQPSEMDQGV